MSFAEKLNTVIAEKQSYVCVGLDTDPGKIPISVSGSETERMLDFNKKIIDATLDFAAAYKINSAFYESVGAEGMQVLRETVDHVPDNTVAIVDAKRGDIGNTAQQYARAVFEYLQADAVTLNPYMGYDSIAPFAAYEDRGSFILCLTSNKSAADIQKVGTAEGVPVYVHTAKLIVSWNFSGNLGMVVGATQPEELQTVREIAPDIPLLIPGIGAQGGDLEKTVAFGIGKNRSPVLINSSRGIIYKSSGTDFAEAAAAECKKLRDSINELVNK
ncbi:orotidine-5'-phosphate decarboxylase [candidate division KSB1 bacterium]